MIDKEYLMSIYQYILENQNKRVLIEDLTDSPYKFIFHVIHYVNNKAVIYDYLGADQYIDVSFNSDYTRLTIYSNSISTGNVNDDLPY